MLSQAMWRRYKGRCARLDCIAQMSSDWEQMWSKEEKIFYYYHKKTGESVWEEPQIPYRPMIRDRYTGRLIQAWPHLDWPAPQEKKAARGACMKCFERVRRFIDSTDRIDIMLI